MILFNGRLKGAYEIQICYLIYVSVSHSVCFFFDICFKQVNYIPLLNKTKYVLKKDIGVGKNEDT